MIGLSLSLTVILLLTEYPLHMFLTRLGGNQTVETRRELCENCTGVVRRLDALVRRYPFGTNPRVTKLAASAGSNGGETDGAAAAAAAAARPLVYSDPILFPAESKLFADDIIAKVCQSGNGDGGACQTVVDTFRPYLVTRTSNPDYSVCDVVCLARQSMTERVVLSVRAWLMTPAGAAFLEFMRVYWGTGFIVVAVGMMTAATLQARHSAAVRQRDLQRAVEGIQHKGLVSAGGGGAGGPNDHVSREAKTIESLVSFLRQEAKGMLLYNSNSGVAAAIGGGAAADATGGTAHHQAAARSRMSPTSAGATALPAR